MESIPLSAFVRRCEAQGVSTPNHYAVVCPMCKTVQSMASLILAGADPVKIESVFGFSCVGRFNDAGPWPNDPKKQRRRLESGCDWTLGGLFKIHELEVTNMPGRDTPRPCFALATPEQAQALERELAAPLPATV